MMTKQRRVPAGSPHGGEFASGGGGGAKKGFFGVTKPMSAAPSNRSVPIRHVLAQRALEAKVAASRKK